MLGLCTVQASAKETLALKTDKEKVSYGIGVDIGRNFKRMGIDIDLNVLTKGFKEAYTDKKLDISEEELRTIMAAYRMDVMKKQVEILKATGEANKKAGEAFLADNGKKFGVITLPSGLQYKVLTTGAGKKPTDDDIVECNYKGTLIDGTEFDSSYRTGKPAQFNLSGVIPGWKEALKLMPTGSKWQIFVPAALAYGERGAGRDIGPNATIIFEVELLNIQAAAAQPATSSH